ncbi:acetyltransferas-like protein [Delitschia confertaspora ATCC 74209]|uniref:Acetyltransferas-like protein n=1 Tax=Delitschia confertaspora ATCC 74209 TaxID=1513339 RepID=A0A9P4JL81_9PLEO|nr:acetyltransferas-like protein [Delitschia confertaspora ATCC 74209]
MSKIMTPEATFEGLCLKPLSSYSAKEQQKILKDVKKIEKKTFPTTEAFDFDSELKKKNSNLIVAVKEGQCPDTVAYLVYVRIKRLTLLHKICVVEQERGKGLAKAMVHSLRLQLEKGGCRTIHLWVDEARQPARSLYASCGFHQIDSCLDYYGPGRTGLKLELNLK